MIDSKLVRTFLLAIGTVIWTVAMGFTGFATSFVFLLLARMWVGGLEANSPAAISLGLDGLPLRIEPFADVSVAIPAVVIF